MIPTPFFREIPATATWETVNVQEIWSAIDDVLPQLDTNTQVAVVGEVIARLVELFVIASEQVFEELDATTTQDGPRMTIEQFMPFVRQSMELDFSQFVGGFDRDGERGPYAPRIPQPQVLPEDGRTIVAIVDAATLADAVEELESAVEPEVIDLETAIELAHQEDVEGWAKAISVYFEDTQMQTVSLRTLQQALGLPWIEVWLGLLLGGYRLEQRGTDFYAGDIWVCY
jgi:hypothetical protein